MINFSTSEGGLKQLSLLLPQNNATNYAITRMQGEQTQKLYLQEDIFIYAFVEQPYSTETLSCRHAFQRNCPRREIFTTAGFF